MDLSGTIAPKSDQVDADDFLSGPRTVTITGVRAGSSNEQPVEIELTEFDRPWRPSLGMRRVLIKIWGANGQDYIGRRITLFCDPTVKFGGIAVGGIRISHMSDIDETKKIPLTESRGKKKIFTVDPLPPAEQPVVWSGLTDAMKATGADQQAVLDIASRVTGAAVESLHGLTQDQVDLLTAAIVQGSES